MGLNVLIVDDDRDFAESLADVFELRGHAVSVACTGEQALDLYQRCCYDLALMDVQLPGMNGVESLQAIRRLRPAARVIMMTGYSVERLVQQAVDEGALGVFHKPLDMERVLFTLDRVPPTGILVVDDDADSAASIAELLDDRGYRTLIADGGQAALDRIEVDDFDVVVLDLRMPGVDGLDVYRRMLANGRTIPTVIVTGYLRDESDRIRALRALPVAAILEKPVNPRHLLAEVEKLLGTRNL